MRARREPEWRDGCTLHYHDTYTAYRMGCRCPAAKADQARYQKRIRAGVKPHALLDGRGTKRRVRALLALGWSCREIGARAGISANAVQELSRTRKRDSGVQLATAQRIDRVYRELHMQPGPSQVVRTRAQQAGYAPPLAWDDIDRDERPVVASIGRGKRPGSVEVDEIRHFRAYGYSAPMLAAKFGVQPESLERAAHRAGDRRLASALHAERTGPQRATA